MVFQHSGAICLHVLTLGGLLLAARAWGQQHGAASM